MIYTWAKKYTHTNTQTRKQDLHKSRIRVPVRLGGKRLNFIRRAHNHRATVCLCSEAGQCVHIRFCEALTRCDSPALPQRSTNLVHFSAFSIYNASVEISLFQNGQWPLSFSFPTSPCLFLTHIHTHKKKALLADTRTLACCHAHFDGN